MSISAADLKKHLNSLRPLLVGRHLSRLVAYCENAYYAFLAGEGPHRLAIVLSDDDPRLYLAKDGKDVPSLESGFSDLLRKELANAFVTGLDVVNDDRVACLSLTIINSVYKEEGRSLYFELIPHHANLILCDEDDNVIAAYRPGSLEDERPFLKGMHYVYPPKKDFLEKPSSFDENDYDEKCLSKEKELDEKRKNDRFGFLFVELNHKEKLLERKEKAVEEDIERAKSHLNDGDYGDYIYMNMSSLKERQPNLLIEGETIALDPSKSLSVNAQTFYKRAKKSRVAIELETKNLETIKNDLLDAKSALSLLKEADEEGLETLAKTWGLSAQKRVKEKKKESTESNHLSREVLPYFVDYKGTKILFGKSARQNDTLTFLLDTSKGHTWLHVNGTTGSHVMVKKENATAEEIQMAAEIALLNSSLVEGEVMVTSRSEVRKGQVPGLAIVKKFTILRLKSVSKDAIELLKSARKVEL